MATTSQPPEESRWARSRNPATAADRRAYEQDCLEYTRWLLQKSSDVQAERHELLQAELEGEYPETAISVRWRDRYYGEEHLDAYRIWDPVLRAHDGGREMPNQVALLVATWISERQQKPPGT